MEFPVIGTQTGAALKVGSSKQLNLDTRRVYTEFRQWPIFKGQQLANGTKACAAPTGAAGDVNNMLVPSLGCFPAAVLEWFVHGTQTILAPVQTDVGLDIGMDQTDNDGITIDTGITARQPLIFTIGTDAFYLKVTVKVQTTAGVDPLLVGFRKVAARQGDFNDYTDFATIGNVMGDIKTETALNNAATVVTDTTDNWANAAAHTLEVYVDKAGAVTYKVDGEEPTTVVAYSFDSADTVMPFVHMLQANAAQSGTVELSLFDCGLQ